MLGVWTDGSKIHHLGAGSDQSELCSIMLYSICIPEVWFQEMVLSICIQESHVLKTHSRYSTTAIFSGILGYMFKIKTVITRFFIMFVDFYSGIFMLEKLM